MESGLCLQYSPSCLSLALVLENKSLQLIFLHCNLVFFLGVSFLGVLVLFEGVGASEDGDRCVE